MSLIAADVNGYLGDVATIEGWRQFREWAEQQDGELAALARRGFCDHPDLLVEQLKAVRRTPSASVASTCAEVLSLALTAEETFIVSDGTSDKTE